MNDSGEVRVTKRIVVAFSIRRYNNDIICDVVPMQVGHMLLGRFDRHIIRDVYRNNYTFEYNDTKITFAPLSPKEVYEDQVKIQQSPCVGSSSEQKKNEERKEANR